MMRVRLGCLVCCALSLGACGTGDGAGKQSPGFEPTFGAKAVAVLAAPAGAPTSRGDAGAGEDCMGRATFAVTSEGTDLVLHLNACGFGVYPVHVHDARSCAEVAAEPSRWPAGTGIPTIASNRNENGTIYYTRSFEGQTGWNIGEPAAANLVGRTLVVHDALDGMRPIACGVIEAQEVPPLPALPDPLPAAELRAILAGQCLYSQVVGAKRPGCPDPTALSECASIHCDLDRCVVACADYLACLQNASDRCGGECIPDTACGECIGTMPQCTWGFCEDELACAEPAAPDGPCRQFEHCCRQQREFEANCLEILRRAERSSGDPTCLGLVHDWDWNENKPYSCSYELGTDLESSQPSAGAQGSAP